MMNGMEKIVTNEYLTFTLDGEHYAFEVFQVREVLEMIKITRVPRMPGYMLGVINLRGSVVPVVDLRLKFGLPGGERTRDSSIVILDVKLGEEEILLGTFVDSVQEVIDLQEGEIEPPPRIGTKLETEFIRGIGKRNDDFIIILNINRIFTTEEISSLGTVKEDLTNE
jgi:purine-binding chemotaxis protein CheW